MSFHRSWPGRTLAVGSLVAVITSVPATTIADDALRHPEGTLKLAERQLVAGSAVPIGGEKFAEHGKLELLLVGVTGRFSLGDVTADSVGGFAESFDIPVDLELGAYRLVAIATDGDEVASLNVELLAAAPSSDEDAGHAPTDEPLILDRTGGRWVRGGAVVGIMIALVGGGLLLRKPQGTV